jgi:hypothetical protein
VRLDSHFVTLLDERGHGEQQLRACRVLLGGGRGAARAECNQLAAWPRRTDDVCRIDSANRLAVFEPREVRSRPNPEPLCEPDRGSWRPIYLGQLGTVGTAAAAAT